MRLILLALAVSLDGMWAGLAQGLRGRPFTAGRLLAAGAVSWLASALALEAGLALAGTVGRQAAAWLGTAVFLGIGLANLREALRYGSRRPDPDSERNPAVAPEEATGQPSPAGEPLEWSQVLLLALAVALDASLAACALAMGGTSSPLIPPLFGLAHIVLVGAGNKLGLTALSHPGLHPASPFVQRLRRGSLRLAPALIFLILGMTRAAQALGH